MTHPPIPPKSKFFIVEDGETWFRYSDPHSSADIDVVVGMHCEGTTRIIAAVAEVEWRRRAERWWELRDRLSDRIFKAGKYGTTGHLRSILMPRMEACLDAQALCYEHADAWRTWGENK